MQEPAIRGMSRLLWLARGVRARRHQPGCTSARDPSQQREDSTADRPSFAHDGRTTNVSLGAFPRYPMFNQPPGA
ncbi:hypothetical protein BDP55DRAFT_641741 [Colletotrichum godetiae]|uniref:Uncharacterized protein n=1 Tax=Colletotrichum godetiae TaxID=1209918 RepID=A0AAJ0EZN8_9PEZI|nr:uncharacterized protein BDP55DRAFT_641741 [Colletotrichum godetiae]KAK1701489.1 hypothetical protein BDP55DRAFT_641741 [Colletotrichum godetiae]